jgi:molybdenum cofactor synthesis domain-containing protein
MSAAFPETGPALRPSAAVLLIGDELLSGKIRDENGFFMAQVLRRRGIQLVEMSVVSDEVGAIGDALLRLLARAPIVFTSGGVGPTHDDRTLEAIADATGRPLERSPRMQTILEGHYGDRISPAALSMADLPRGTSLRAEAGWPVLRLDLAAGEGKVPLREAGRVYILPGIPSLLKAKVEALEALPDELPSHQPLSLVALHTRTEEARLAPALDEVVAEFGEVAIGSYPRWDPGPDGRLRQVVRVTFESAELARADAARERLRALLDPTTIVD